MKNYSLSEQIIQRVEAAVTQAQIDAYKKDGAVCIHQILSPIEIELLRTGIELNLSAPSPRVKIASKNDDPGQFIEDFCTWQTNPHYQQFIFESPVSLIAGKLMESKKQDCIMITFWLKNQVRGSEPHGIRISPITILKEYKIAVYGYLLIQYLVHPPWSLSQVLIWDHGSCLVRLWITKQNGFQKEASLIFQILTQNVKITPLLAGK